MMVIIESMMIQSFDSPVYSVVTAERRGELALSTRISSFNEVFPSYRISYFRQLYDQF